MGVCCEGFVDVAMMGDPREQNSHSLWEGEQYVEEVCACMCMCVSFVTMRYFVWYCVDIENTSGIFKRLPT